MIRKKDRAKAEVRSRPMEEVQGHGTRSAVGEQVKIEKHAQVCRKKAPRELGETAPEREMVNDSEIVKAAWCTHR